MIPGSSYKKYTVIIRVLFRLHGKETRNLFIIVVPGVRGGKAIRSMR